MNDVLSRYLILARRVCADVGAGLPAGEQKTKLAQLGVVLEQVVFDTTVLPAVQDDHLPEFAALAGSRSLGFVEARAAICTRLGRADLANQSDLGFARAVQAADWSFDTARKKARDAMRAAPIQPPAAEESFNAEAFRRFVAEAIPGESNIRVVDARVASRGFSKKTMLVTLEGNKVLPSELALRIDQNLEYLGTTVLDEFDALRLVCAHGVRAPNPFALEATGKVLGHPFIIFPRVSGAPAGGVYHQPPRSETLSADAARCLATLHKVPIEGLQGVGASRNLDRPYIDYDMESYYKKWTSYGLAHPTIELAFAWIRAHRGDIENGRRGVVHNDFTYNNILVERDRITAVLDWEFVHIGHTASDLGYHYYAAEGVSSFEHFLNVYESEGGVAPSKKELDFYILWGQLRLIVMMFGMPKVFESGVSDDIRYALGMPTFYDEAMRRLCTKLEELLAKP